MTKLSEYFNEGSNQKIEGLRDRHDMGKETSDIKRYDTRKNANNIAVWRLKCVSGKNVCRKPRQKRQQCRVDEQDQLCQEI